MSPAKRSVNDFGTFLKDTDLLRRYLSISPILFVLLDRQGKIRFLNKKAAATLGVKNADVSGQNWFTKFVPSEQRRDVKKLFDSLVASKSKTSLNYEDNVIVRDGRTKIISWHNTILRAKDGTVTAVVALGEDVSDRKQTEQALSESERRLESVVRTIPDIVYRLDEHGKIVFISDAVRSYGYSPRNLIGKAFIQYVHPDDQERVKYNVGERRTGNRRTQSVELRLTVKNHRRKPKTTPIKKVVPERVFMLDAEGLYNSTSPVSQSFMGTQGIARDITTLKTTQTEASRLASVVEQASESIVITDPSGRVEYVNPNFEQSSGYTFDEVNGKNLRFLKSGEQNAEFYENLWQTILRGESWEGTFINKRKNGTYFYEDATIFPILDKSNTVINYAAVKRDISAELKLKKQLQQAQKMEAMGQLAGGIAHDFNNILSVINGYSELAMMSMDKKNGIYKKLKEINEAGLRAKDLVDQLLAFSRRQIIEPKIINLNHLIPELNRMMLRLLDEDIKITFKFAEELWSIKADPGQLEQILINLIVNARDAIRQSGDDNKQKEIYVETKNVVLDQKFVEHHPGSRVGFHVELSIEDSGSGMDDLTQAKIFEPFFTTKRENQGTGLGLATVYGIVKQNNGSIYVYSEPGMGTTFRIFWPSEAGAKMSTEKGLKKEQIPSGRETILLVEDNIAVREFTHEALESLGYTVYVAENGRKALELVKDKQISIDLLVTDVIMPEIGGRELVSKLKKTQQMQVLYTSGYTDQHIVSEGVLEEGVNFLQKPYTLNKLASKIRTILTD